MIGGSLSADAYANLLDVIELEAVSTDWDEALSTPADRAPGQPLRLCAHEVAWGRFQSLEDWLLEAKLPFVRWAGGCSGSFGPERVIAVGDGTLSTCAVNDDDEVVFDRQTIGQLDSMEAVRAYFAAADFKVPPFFVDGDPLPP